MILALSESVTAAMVGPITVALLAVLGAAIKVGFRIRDELAALRADQAHRIGTPNGHGNVVEMSEKLLAGQTGQDARIAVLEKTTNRLEAGQRDQGKRLGVVEREVTALKGAPCLGSPEEVA